MGPNALLVCAERQSLKVLESLLDELEISHDACHCCADAMERAVRGQYSALVLDFDLEGCAQLGKLARMAAPQQRSVLFALVGASTPLNDTSHAGANVVLYKPLNLDQVRAHCVPDVNLSYRPQARFPPSGRDLGLPAVRHRCHARAGARILVNRD